MLSEQTSIDYRRAVTHNILCLYCAMATFYAVLLMATAIGPSTFIQLSGINSLAGLPAALFGISMALVAKPAGSAMDHHGRVRVIKLGFLLGIVGMLLVAAAVHVGSAIGVLGGFVLVGAASAIIMLARLAGADMSPPNRQGRGISLILFGCVPGAIIGAALFSWLFAKGSSQQTLIQAWCMGGGLLAVGYIFVSRIKVDPKQIAAFLAQGTQPDADLGSHRVIELLRAPGMVPTLCLAVGAHSIMVAIMSLVGFMMIQLGHHQHTSFWVVGIHLLGMFGLVLIIGEIIDQFGRKRAMAAGGILILGSLVVLAVEQSLPVLLLSMFLLGIGWSFAFVGATTSLASLVSFHERGRLIGFNDVLANLSGATFTLLSGAVFAREGINAVLALAMVWAVFLALAAFWLVRKLRATTPSVYEQAERERLYALRR